MLQTWLAACNYGARGGRVHLHDLPSSLVCRVLPRGDGSTLWLYHGRKPSRLGNPCDSAVLPSSVIFSAQSWSFESAKTIGGTIPGASFTVAVMSAPTDLLFRFPNSEMQREGLIFISPIGNGESSCYVMETGSKSIRLASQVVHTRKWKLTSPLYSTSA